MDDTIHIAACCDDNYAPYAGVMMLSALRATPDARIQFHLVSCGISDQNLRNLRETVHQAGGELLIHEPNHDLYQGLPTHRYGPAVYQRINLPAVIPDAISRILYLDSDTLVLDDLNELWRTDLKGQPVAAVENFSPTACRDIHVDRQDYFNSGVLLMDLAIWREEGLHRQVTDYARAHADSLQFVDQCSLNAVLQGRWARLAARWNQQGDVYSVMTRYVEGCSYSVEELYEAFIAPGIVHYIGKKKPWKIFCFHPFKGVYRRVLADTPWAGIRAPDDSFSMRLKYWTSLGKLWNYQRRRMQIAAGRRNRLTHEQ